MGTHIFPVSQALQDSKHPIIDKSSEKYQAPLDLNDVSLEYLLEKQEYYHQELKELNRNLSQEKSPQLVSAMHSYDLSRLGIVEVIPRLIKAYTLNGDIKKQLLTYAETFNRLRDDYQKMEKGVWENYRAYDFRLGIAYQSMLYLFAQNDDLYQRLRADMQDRNTVIGAYVHELELAHGKVEAINAKNPEYYLIHQIEKELKRIRNEIGQR